ncbi:MAG TPA: acetyltransferase [Candidatus Eisenbergiella merdipullorum]|uniref:Acetyltransferase n=1 Tax=Candidatus Eisenbergiella merdipullorum TaxID=2838553 RepID=A0A9D2I6J8_9FIRM|nr:acetyltransferase [Candidatus Eisenbergiella merdipullorum]
MRAVEEDFLLYLKWMTDPLTMKYWEGMTEHFTYQRVIEEYWAGIREGVIPCIIIYQGKSIGFCQFCILNPQYYEVPAKLYYSFAGRTELVYGIDIFLGETEYRNHGIGSQALMLLMRALFSDYHADCLMIDPKIHNTRAIRCYHKAGFRDLFIVPHRELQDGIYHDSLIMGLKKSKT